MKVRTWPLAFALAACRPIVGVTTLPTGLAKAPAGAWLLSRTEGTTNGTLTNLDLKWDLGDRPFRELRCGGMVQRSGPPDNHPKAPTVSASFRATSKGKAKLTVELREIGDHSSGTSTTSSEITLDGGLSAVQIVPVDATETKTVTLLRWKERGGPTALSLTFG